MNNDQIFALEAIAAAMIEAMGMHAENMSRSDRGASMAYTDDAFHSVNEHMKERVRNFI